MYKYNENVKALKYKYNWNNVEHNMKIIIKQSGKNYKKWIHIQSLFNNKLNGNI